MGDRGINIVSIKATGGQGHMSRQSHHWGNRMRTRVSIVTTGSGQRYWDQHDRDQYSHRWVNRMRTQGLA